MAQENTQNTQQNTEVSKEEALSLLKGLMGGDKKEDKIDTQSFMLGMAAGAAVTGISIYVYNKFFNEDWSSLLNFFLFSFS